jgi:hypothetical protein
MPALTAETTDYQLDIDTGQRCHWIVGRDPSCELLLEDKGVSRYHATVFHVEGRFHVVDHSLNGSHLFRGDEELKVALSAPAAIPPDGEPDVVGFETSRIEPVAFVSPRLDGAPEGFDPHQSVTELRLQQLRSDVPHIPGYRPHSLTDAGHVKPLLDMIYGDQAETLASMARSIEPGNVLLFCGLERHYFRFVE